MNIKYSLVIPCYNEAENLNRLAARCLLLLERRSDVEVVLVDNGSIDTTREVLGAIMASSAESRLRSVRVNTNAGYGHGILHGLKNCCGTIRGWTHADLQTDPLDFLRAIEIFDNSRWPNKTFVKGKRVDRPLRDVVFTIGMSIFESVVLGTKMSDINAQPTVFSNDFFESLTDIPNDFSLDLFIYNSAIRKGLILERFPVSFKARSKGVGHNDLISSKIKYSYRTIRYSMELKKRLRHD